MLHLIAEAMPWIAGFCELLGIYVVGNKNKYGFLWSAACDIIWIFVAFRTGVWGLLIAVVPAFFINIINFIKWSKRKKKKRKLLIDCLFNPTKVPNRTFKINVSNDRT